ncbi:hypothetical protein LPB72_00850 [Hydrogenophaga crassostreae]|uniref:Protein-disulfide isomerase n=1 Tax=Hydrogenophaga crassostreae TaxID=1763535 RepID=A0A170AJB3_9BURK|nr:hypothetical protein [Hydrogenophaga crassostreae]AOW13945.1 hypothetical protein LPB072_14965 [Hydrogenophaga crassostreae]OAD44090.1 hypothetical protein LPB72_00850 [Hydrogenophaga crassostreae]
MVKHLTYLMDPFCGWCYGAAPMIQALRAEANVQITIAPTGLFAGDSGGPMNAEFASFAWTNDQRIANLTGQRFTAAYRTQLLNDHSKRFDSGPATLALTAVHLTAPERELDALSAFQLARYVDGRDTADLNVLAAILGELALHAAADRLISGDDVLVGTSRKRMSSARRDMATFGAQGVPNLILSSSETRQLLSGGLLYGDPAPLLTRLRTT